MCRESDAKLREHFGQQSANSDHEVHFVDVDDSYVPEEESKIDVYLMAESPIKDERLSDSELNQDDAAGENGNRDENWADALLDNDTEREPSDRPRCAHSFPATSLTISVQHVSFFIFILAVPRKQVRRNRAWQRMGVSEALPFCDVTKKTWLNVKRRNATFATSATSYAKPKTN